VGEKEREREGERERERVFSELSQSSKPASLADS
jgi:hypothetical protein